MVAARKKDTPVELRKRFADEAWVILWAYLERLGSPGTIEKADSRAAAGVIKTLLESIDRAQVNIPEEEPQIELPEIPEKALDEALRICFPELLPGGNAAKPRRARTGLCDRQAAASPP